MLSDYREGAFLHYVGWFAVANSFTASNSVKLSGLYLDPVIFWKEHIIETNLQKNYFMYFCIKAIEINGI